MPYFFSFLDQFGRDIRFGLRSFLRTPTLSGLALVSLALGIGATTAIFSAVYSVILDPFPYGDAQHLMSIQIRQGGDAQTQIAFSSDQYLDIAAHAESFADLAGSIWSPVAVTGEGDPQRIDGAYTTTNIFRVLEVRPLLGRGFLESDSQPEAAAVAVLSYKCWQRVFNAEQSVLGKQIRLNDQMRTIVGVMPERVYWLDADIYLPVSFQYGQNIDRGDSVLILGRIKNGVTQAQAETNLHSVFSEIARREPAQFPDRWQAKAVPFPEAFPTKVRSELLMLLSAVGLLLVIACANVSSLLLSKATARQKEMAIRSSLGAGRGQIIQQLMTESLMLALAGCLLGLLFAALGLRLILSIVPPETIPSEAKISLNLPVLLFSLAIALVAAFFAGLAPALHVSGERLALGLRENGRGTGGSRKQVVVREGLVVAQVALSLVLLVGAGLMFRTLFALQQVPLGITVDNVLTMYVPLPSNRYKGAAARTLVMENYLNAIRQTPGVIGASLNTRLHPLENERVEVAVVGKSAREARDVMLHQVDEQYFQTLRIALLAGRSWTEAEVLNKRRLAIVNQSFTRRYLADHSPLGGSIHIPELKDEVGDQPFEIIGVTADVLNQGLTKSAAPEVYIPYTLTGSSQALAIRTVQEPMLVARTISAKIRQVDAQQPITEVMSMENLMSRFLLSLSRFQMILFALFASIGLLLAITGIYGVMSNTVARRTPELGIRLALGARPGQVIGLILGFGMRLVLVGIGVGMAGALLLTRFMASFIFGIRATDPISFGAVVVTLGAVGLVACVWPALRASRIDPVRCLRQE